MVLARSDIESPRPKPSILQADIISVQKEEAGSRISRKAWRVLNNNNQLLLKSLEDLFPTRSTLSTEIGGEWYEDARDKRSMVMTAKTNMVKPSTAQQHKRNMSILLLCAYRA